MYVQHGLPWVKPMGGDVTCWSLVGGLQASCFFISSFFHCQLSPVPAKLWWPAPPEYVCQLLLAGGIWEGPTTICVYSLMVELDPSGLSGGPNHFCEIFPSLIHRLGHHPMNKEGGPSKYFTLPLFLYCILSLVFVYA